LVSLAVSSGVSLPVVVVFVGTVLLSVVRGVAGDSDGRYRDDALGAPR
jgi:hypothetical protein